jgi:L-ascorbate metabolism protein UlaG (beta-lactamase superfamily)
MTRSNLEQLLAVDTGIALCWLGNLSWLIRAEDQLIAFDLDLDRQGRSRASPIPTETLAPLLDVHLITHAHEDHFSSATSQILAERSNCMFVVPANCVTKARQIGIPALRLCVARPGQPFDLPGIHIEPQRALHGHLYSSVYRHANFDDCGYVFTYGGKRFLQPGDSVLLHDHLELTAIDVLFVSPTIHNMHIEHSAVLINALEPEYILAQHFGTYVQTESNRYWTKGYPDELKSVLPRQMQKRFHKLDQGEVFVVKAAE